MRITETEWKKKFIIVVKHMGLRVNILGYKPKLCHLTAMWSWASYLMSLHLNFISWKIEITVIS